MTSTTDNIPHATSVSEEYICNKLGIEIYTRTWEPLYAKILAKVLFVHGHGEHIGRYDSVFQEFAKAGIKVHAFDQVGCGKTGEKQKDLGGAMGLSQVLSDITDGINRLKDNSTFSHGGGASILNYLAIGEKRDLIHGAISNAPCINVAEDCMPSFALRFIINNLGCVFPKVKIEASIDTSYLSKVKEVEIVYKKDPLIFRKSSLIQIRDLLFEGPKLLKERGPMIEIPRLLIAHGTEDRIVCYKSTSNLADFLKMIGKIPDFKFISYEGGYHEIHNDTMKKQVISDYIQWILERLN